MHPCTSTCHNALAVTRLHVCVYACGKIAQVRSSSAAMDWRRRWRRSKAAEVREPRARNAVDQAARWRGECNFGNYSFIRFHPFLGVSTCYLRKFESFVCYPCFELASEFNYVHMACLIMQHSISFERVFRVSTCAETILIVSLAPCLLSIDFHT